MNPAGSLEVLVLLGPPGSGKGTQAVRLAAECGLPHISTGDLFRSNVKGGTELGAKAKEFMNAGKLVPDSLVLDMLFDRVGNPDCGDGYILDGFPRTLPQAEAYGEQLPGGTALSVLDLRVDDEILVERAAGRLSCKSCGHIHHATFSPPKQEGVCDACGTAGLERRVDDAPDVVRQRLAVYHEQTAPLTRFYEEQGVLTVIDGERTPDEVFQQLLGAVRGAGVDKVEG